MKVWVATLSVINNKCEFHVTKVEDEYQYDEVFNNYRKENGWLINVIPNYIEINENNFGKCIWKGYDHKPTENELKIDKVKMVAMMKELLEREYRDIQFNYEQVLLNIDKGVK